MPEHTLLSRTVAAARDARTVSRMGWPNGRALFVVCAVGASVALAGCSGSVPSPSASPGPSAEPSPLPTDYLEPRGDGYTAQALVDALAPGGTTTVTSETFAVMFEASTAGIPHRLPPSAGRPELPAMLDVAGPGAHFEIGLVDRAALQHWMCAWMDALLEADVDEATGLAALELVPALPHTYVLGQPEVAQLADAAADGVDGYDLIQRRVCPTPTP